MYLLSFWLNNVGGDTPNQFLVNWNTNAAGTNAIFNQTNVGMINAWSNFLFVVTTTGTSTTLQVGALNENYSFGLDDVSVVPVPPPQFTASGKPTNAFALAWYSVPVVSYQV